MSKQTIRSLDDKKQTVGEISTELLAKNQGAKQSVLETQFEAQKDYMKHIEECAENGIKFGYKEDFYVCCARRRERTLVNVVRQQFFHRQTRPTPMWDMDLWKVDPKTSDVYYCWTLPDKETGEHMIEFPQEFKEKAPELLNFVLLFSQSKLI